MSKVLEYRFKYLWINVIQLKFIQWLVLEVHKFCKVWALNILRKVKVVDLIALRTGIYKVRDCPVF